MVQNLALNMYIDFESKELYVEAGHFRILTDNHRKLIEKALHCGRMCTRATKKITKTFYKNGKMHELLLSTCHFVFETINNEFLIGKPSYE